MIPNAYEEYEALDDGPTQINAPEFVPPEATRSYLLPDRCTPEKRCEHPACVLCSPVIVADRPAICNPAARCGHFTCIFCAPVRGVPDPARKPSLLWQAAAVVTISTAIGFLAYVSLAIAVAR